MAESPQSPRRVEAAGRASKAVALRMARASYAQIAQQCGFSDESGARKAVRVALEKTRRVTTESAEELRQLDLAKLDEMEMRLTSIVRKGAPREVSDAARTLVSVMKRRADLVGLDAALKVQHIDAPDSSAARSAALAAAMTTEELRGLDAIYTAAEKRVAELGDVSARAGAPEATNGPH